jgi:hypothetical protein
MGQGGMGQPILKLYELVLNKTLFVSLQLQSQVALRGISIQWLFPTFTCFNLPEVSRSAISPFPAMAIPDAVIGPAT